MFLPEDAPIEMKNTHSKQVVIDDNDSEGGANCMHRIMMEIPRPTMSLTQRICLSRNLLDRLHQLRKE